MRIKRPEQFDPDREYKIGDRLFYNGRMLIAVKYTQPPKWLVKECKNIFFAIGKMPTQCGMCEIKYKDCNGMVKAPCQKWNRKDKRDINFRFLRNETIKNK